MNILLNENINYDLNTLPDEIDDLRFCILDNSDPSNVDYYFIPLIFLESFTVPALVLKVGKHQLKVPIDWQLLIGEPDFPDLEVVPVTSINDRGFKAFSINPIKAYRPDFLDVEITDVYSDNKWFFPKLKSGQLLAVPLTSGPNPTCIFIAKDINKNNEIIKLNEVW